MPIKLSKSSQAKAPRPGGAASTAKQSNPTLAASFVLALVLGLAAAIGYSQLQSKATIYVAKREIPPYTTLTKSMFNAVKVPRNSVTANDLTPELFDRKFGGGRNVPITRLELLAGQRVDQRALLSSTTGALAAVKSDEVVVAINTTLSGIIGGAITPGSVVDVIPSSGGVLSQASITGNGGKPNKNASQSAGAVGVADNVKVLGVGVGAAAGQNISSATDNSNVKNAKDNGSGGNVIVVLAVPAADAATVLSTPDPMLALNPHLRFDQAGNLCPVDKCKTVSTPDGPQAGSSQPTTGTGAATGIDNGTGSGTTARSATGANGTSGGITQSASGSSQSTQLPPDPTQTQAGGKKR